MGGVLAGLAGGLEGLLQGFGAVQGLKRDRDEEERQAKLDELQANQFELQAIRAGLLNEQLENELALSRALGTPDERADAQRKVLRTKDEILELDLEFNQARAARAPIRQAREDAAEAALVEKRTDENLRRDLENELRQFELDSAREPAPTDFAGQLKILRNRRDDIKKDIDFIMNEQGVNEGNEARLATLQSELVQVSDDISRVSGEFGAASGLPGAALPGAAALPETATEPPRTNIFGGAPGQGALESLSGQGAVEAGINTLFAPGRAAARGLGTVGQTLTRLSGEREARELAAPLTGTENFVRTDTGLPIDLRDTDPQQVQQFLQSGLVRSITIPETETGLRRFLGPGASAPPSLGPAPEIDGILNRFFSRAFQTGQ